MSRRSPSLLPSHALSAALIAWALALAAALSLAVASGQEGGVRSRSPPPSMTPPAR